MEEGQSYFEKYKFLHIGSGIALLFWLALTLFFMISIQQSGSDNLDFYFMVARTTYVFQGISLSLMAVQIILMVFYKPLGVKDFVFGLGLALVIVFSIKDLIDGIYQFFVDPDLLLTLEPGPVDHALTTLSMVFAYVLLLGQVMALITSRLAKKKDQASEKNMDTDQEKARPNEEAGDEKNQEPEEEVDQGEDSQEEGKTEDDQDEPPKP